MESNATSSMPADQGSGSGSDSNAIESVSGGQKGNANPGSQVTTDPKNASEKRSDPAKKSDPPPSNAERGAGNSLDNGKGDYRPGGGSTGKADRTLPAVKKNADKKQPPKNSEKTASKSPLKKIDDPKVQKPVNNRLLKSIIIVVLILITALIVFLIVRKMKKEEKPDITPDKDLPSKAELAKAMERFKSEFKNITASAEQQDIMTLVISLYNLLLSHYEGCGLAKPDYITPDEFHRSEYIYRTWSKNALAHVTEIFNRVFYGNKRPATKEFTTYCENIAQLGQMLTKIAPYKAK